MNLLLRALHTHRTVPGAHTQGRQRLSGEGTGKVGSVELMVTTTWQSPHRCPALLSLQS